MDGNILSLLLVPMVPVDDEVEGPCSLLVVSPRLLVDVTPGRKASQPRVEFNNDDDNAGPAFPVSDP